MRIKEILKKLLFPGERLSQKAISASIWMVFLRVGNRLLGLVRIVVLARLLAPHDFGLFGIALIVLSFLNTFSQPGTGEALVQKKDDIKSYLDTAWTIKVIRGIAMSCILFFSAPFVARFFNEPNATNLIYVLGVSLIFAGLGNQGIIYFAKDLEFNKQFIYETSSTLADLGVSVILAFTLRNAFALAYGYLAGIIVMFVVSYIIHPYRPKFKLDLNQSKELFGYGKWIWIENMAFFLLTQGVATFIGKLLGAIALGVYQMAYRITSTATSEAAIIFSRVTFPFYSKLQDKLIKLREAYVKVLKINSFIITPISFVIISFSSHIVNVVLGDKWIATIPIIKILALYGLLESLSSANYSLFKSIGRPDISTKTRMAKFLILCILTYPLSIKWGIAGASYSLLISNLIIGPIEFFIVSRKIILKFTTILKILTIPALNASITVFTTGIIAKIIAINIDTLILFIYLSASALFYLAISFLTDFVFNFGLRRMLSKNYVIYALGIEK